MNIPSRRRARFTAAPLPILMALLSAVAGGGCQLPGQQATEVMGEKPSAVLERCAAAARRMHFDVKAIDRSHLIVVAEGKVEGNLAFHPVHLSIKVIHLGQTRYRVEVISTGDERGIRAGAEKKARRLYFRALEETPR